MQRPPRRPPGVAAAPLTAAHGNHRRSVASLSPTPATIFSSWRCRALIAVLTWHQVRRWRRRSEGEALDGADASAAGDVKASKAAGPPAIAISARASSEGSSGGSSGGDTPRPQAGRPAAAEDDAAAIDRAAHAIVDAAEEEAQRKWVLLKCNESGG